MKSTHRVEQNLLLRLPGPAVLTSVNNPTIKQIRALRLRKERERTGLFFVEGIRFVAAALQSSALVEAVFSVSEQLKSARIQDLYPGLRRNSLPNIHVSPAVLQTMADREDTQGIGVVVQQRWEQLEQIRPAAGRGWVVLDKVQYPGNLGAILRACDAVGFEGVILIGPSADPYDPAAVRASMGAVFFQRLIRSDYVTFADWKQKHRLTLVGASPNAINDYRETRYTAPTLLYLGSEGQGLSPEQLALCDHAVRIPMAGRCDSLNLALATGLVLYEVFYQSRTRKGGEGVE